MKRHIIAGYYGDKDEFNVDVRSNEVLTKVDLIHSKKMGLGIGAALDDLAKKDMFPSELGIDLLVVATHVQIADTRISRDSESQDSWTREIRLLIPVADPDLWSSVAKTLIKTLNFLTGDLWIVVFRQKSTSAQDLMPKGTLPMVEGPSFDGVSLFSGGLDSLIGAIDIIESGGIPLLVSHAGDGATSESQENCEQKIKEAYPNNSFYRLRLWMDLKNLSVIGSEHETTTRGRSFLFFATGIFAGTGLEKEFVLRVPENGLIALNVPLDPLRLGSHSTRTTHPYYIAKWNELLKGLGITASIQNPYWNKTKGEMVAECANKELLKTVAPLSSSCSSLTKGRWHGRSPKLHCGYCLPCLIRRAALDKGFGEGVDTTGYSIPDLTKNTLDSMEAEGMQIRSFEFALHRLKTKPKLAKAILHSSGSLASETPQNQVQLLEVYKRGLLEVGEILKGVHTEPKL